MNITKITAVFLIVSAILLNANTSTINLIFFIAALVYFVCLAIKGE